MIEEGNIIEEQKKVSREKLPKKKQNKNYYFINLKLKRASFKIREKKMLIFFNLVAFIQCVNVCETKNNYLINKFKNKNNKDIIRKLIIC